MAKQAGGTVRMAGSRRQFLVYMEPAYIKKVKLQALEREVSASDIVEEAVKDWLNRNVKGTSGKK